MKISSNMLNDTLNLVSLAREIALAKGNQASAEKFGAVEKGIRQAVTETKKSAPEKPVSGVLAQDDFQTLLSVSSNRPQRSDPGERNQIVAAMSAGGMSAVDIARHVGMTVNEVKVVIAVNNQTQLKTEI